MKNTVSKSFRLPKADAQWIKEMATSKGLTHTDIVSKCIASAKINEGKAIGDSAIWGVQNTMDKGGLTQNNEAFELLTQLGIATASGIAGYHLSGWVREQLDMDKDKGTQLLIGLAVGLGTVLLQVHFAKK